MKAKRKRTPVENFKQRISILDPQLGAKINQFLPYWWEHSLSESPGASQQAIVSMARLLNLDLATVLNEHSPLSFKKISCCYKKTADKSYSDLQTSTALIHSFSKTLSAITLNSYKPFGDAESIRKEILSSGKPWVDFISLAQYCWFHGVPVVFIPDIFSTKKMDAVVQKVNDRPVIAITKKSQYDSKLLFLLAHEMGHIYCNHIEDKKVIIDSKIREDQHHEPDVWFSDAEKEANQFALSIITGKEQSGFHSNGSWMKGTELAAQVRVIAKDIFVDPGHIALNWAYTTIKSFNGSPKVWGIATNALKTLNLSPDWKKQLQELFLSNIDEMRGDEDQVEYLFDILKIEG